LEVSKELVDACKKGEPQAFEDLIKATHKQVYSLAYRLMGNPDDAAEVAQETYLKLLRAIKQYRGESSFSTWLYRVTSSVAISQLRKRAKHGSVGSLEQEEWYEVPASLDSDPVAMAEGRALKERLDVALASLPAGYRSVVVMKDLYGLTLGEIGRELGISEGAAKVRLFRARQRLKDELYEDGPAGYGKDVKGDSRGVS